MPVSSRDPAAFIRNGNIDILYASYGQGPLVILLHGFPDHEGTFAAQIEDLSRDHLVVTPRLRGFPPSSVPVGVESYALPAVAEDVAAIVEHFGQGPAVIVGHDWGGALAQAVALRFPHVVKGLALLNAPVLSTFDSVVHGDRKQQAMSAYTLPYLQYQPGDDKNVELVTRNIRNSDWQATISRYLNENPIDGMMAYYKANYAAPPYRPQTPAGYRFGIPTLIVWGTDEEYFAPRVLDGLTEYFAASLRLATVPSAGHWVHQDAPARVNQEIRSWLATLPAPTGARHE
ncbi:alpha/beta hydrolase [Piscinibacter sp. XHJ-5]|uniref:alpha/beta fold hydrolase n=1 Tax=Piscinibacter sp. XHJ-5 TaxID=3037797 RepID=UPI0024528381|nr:alpha/beta hydrolase [Piscinibacter sp. XHJ-5]